MFKYRKTSFRVGMLMVAIIAISMLAACNMPSSIGIDLGEAEEEGGGEAGKPGEGEPSEGEPAEEGTGETEGSAGKSGEESAEAEGGEVEEGGEEGGGSPGTATLTVTNNSGSTVCYLNISPVTDSTWTGESLGSDTIPNGSSYTFQGIEPGDYDLRATNCSGGVLEIVWDTSLTGSHTWTITSAGPGPGPSGGGSISCGQTVNGTLGDGDEHRWTFSGTSGSRVTIAMNETDDMDTYLELLGPSGSEVTHDDDSGDGLNSLISNFSLPSSGTYTIIARGFAHQGGSYRLTLTCGGTGPSPGGNATVRLVNNSGQTVWYAYVSPVTDDNFYTSGDRLGTSTVPAGSTFDITVPAGSYDLLAEGSGHTTIETEWGVSLAAGSTYTWTVTSSGPGPGGNATVRLVNNSGQTVWYAYVSPVTDDNFYTSGDRLGTSTVPAGSTFDITVPAGSYDLLAEGSGHTTIETEWGVSLAAGSTYTWNVTSSGPGPGGNATVRLVNNSGQTVWYAYVSPVTDDNFYTSGDRLGTSTVPAGSTFDITVPAGDYDLLAEGSGHTTIETEWGVHLTAGSTYTWNVTSSGPGPGGNATVRLVNNSGQTVWYAYVSPVTDDNFYTSGDRLGTSTVPAGSTFDITVPAGSYDLLAEGSGHTTIETEWGVSLAAGSTYTWTVTSSGGGGGGGTGNATVRLANNSGQTVWYAYVSPVTDSEWYTSGDRLGSSVVPAGSTFDITVPAGDYDLLAEGSGHTTMDTEWGVHLTAGSTYTWNVP